MHAPRCPAPLSLVPATALQNLPVTDQIAIDVFGIWKPAFCRLKFCGAPLESLLPPTRHRSPVRPAHPAAHGPGDHGASVAGVLQQLRRSGPHDCGGATPERGASGVTAECGSVMTSAILLHEGVRSSWLLFSGVNFAGGFETKNLPRMQLSSKEEPCFLNPSQPAICSFPTEP